MRLTILAIECCQFC